jgi:hypothetical protein
LKELLRESPRRIYVGFNYYSKSYIFEMVSNCGFQSKEQNHMRRSKVNNHKRRRGGKGLLNRGS